MGQVMHFRNSNNMHSIENPIKNMNEGPNVYEDEDDITAAASKIEVIETETKLQPKKSSLKKKSDSNVVSVTSYATVCI